MAQKNIEPLAQLLSRYDIWTNDFSYKLREVAENNPDITDIVFAFNPAHLQRAPYYFRSGDTLCFKDLASENYWEQEWYKNTDNAQWTIANANQAMEVSFSRQIRTADGEFLKGVLKTGILLKKLIEEKDTTGIAYLINKQDSLIVNLQEQTMLRGSNDLETLINGSVSHSEAFINGDVSHCVASAPLSGANWTVKVVINEEMPVPFIEILQEHKKILIINAVIFVFILTLLLFFINRKNTNRNHYHRRIQNRMNSVGR